MRIALSACLIIATLSSSAFGHEPASNQSKGWQLVWQDEFEGKELSHKKWNVLTREQSKHNERQYYVPDEVYLHEGSLRLRSRKRDFGTQAYTSGRVDTSGKFAPVYGRFEIRARLPGGKGLWPAHWLYPQNRDWAMERLMAETVAAGNERTIPEARPWYSEIDIMEFLGHETNVLYGTLHYHTFDGQKKSTSGTYKGSADYTKDFHVYSLEWEPGEMRWFIDGETIHKTNRGIPHAPHYLILNTAIGGAWPGDPDESTTFPQHHDIDYVRVYARKNYFPHDE
jgi:beta-glucanase (GH16 family)